MGLRGGNAPLTPSLRQAWGVWALPAGTVQRRLLLKGAWGGIVLNCVWEAPLSMLKDFLGGWARGTLLGSAAIGVLPGLLPLSFLRRCALVALKACYQKEPTRQWESCSSQNWLSSKSMG